MVIPVLYAKAFERNFSPKQNTPSQSPTSSHVPSTTTIPGVTTSIHVSSTSVGSTVVLSSPGTTTLIGK
jgi:hypothetical protein